MQQRLADQQEQIHQLIANNNLLTQANQRGANLITMKHEAGTMFGQVTDRVADLFGTMRREIPEVAAFVPRWRGFSFVPTSRITCCTESTS